MGMRTSERTFEVGNAFWLVAPSRFLNKNKLSERLGIVHPQ